MTGSPPIYIDAPGLGAAPLKAIVPATMLARALALAGAVALLASGAAPAAADVADSSDAGFTVKINVEIHAAPAIVYNKLINNIGNWWNSRHTFSGDAHNLSIEEKPMGCFCEKLQHQGAVRHMEVLFFDPGKTLRMSGAIGPMQGLAATGVATFTLAPSSAGTSLTLTYTVGGYSPQGMKPLAPLVDQVFTEQITRLKNYVETGDATTGSGTRR